MNPRGTPADPAGILPELQNHWGWKETKSRSQFFRSLPGHKHGSREPVSRRKLQFHCPGKDGLLIWDNPCLPKILEA
jgi:hypothetical protein